MSKNKALFLDRDGVINVEKNYVYKIEDFEFIDGIFDVMRHFQERGYLLIVITNQAGIGRGYYTEEDFNKLNEWMLRRCVDEGIHITKVYYCPYHPEFGIGEYKKDSFDRKPNPGMILRAAEEYEIDLNASILVGDKESDIQAGMQAGVKLNVLLKSNSNAICSATLADCVIYQLHDLRLLLRQ
ncbi:HAD family hydrolase [Cohnella lubricantis]|uniref:D,D-heptose 1,7-bisphosphate phosphatase n=1 Tax=Cohnella lubricantis TaxID=2163172 RepID=A0A841TET6_9BACL|nr:HAD family hydrolase [Cohnella lubricantis]MBB6678776.1 HAD family hydrolase [Cohnella lubricantis]MBP2117860.1 D-glycero-D-manno-heptose 1,7-bisphosphate phosphatase [Cohnella lubricantis]